MMKRGTSWNESEAPDATEPGFKLDARLEEQLASVVEQEGMTIAAPDSGVSRRLPTKIRGARAGVTMQAVFRSNLQPEAPPECEPDVVAEWDAAILDLPVSVPDGGKVHPVSIAFEPHARSPYVISLRQFKLHVGALAQDERAPVAAAFSNAHVPLVQRQDPAVYGTLSQDLCVSAYDPFALRDQFTPDFKPGALRQSWRFERFREAIHIFGQETLGLLQRVERVEKRLGDEIQETLTVDTPRFSFARALAGFVALLFIATIPANAVGVYRSVSKVRDQAESVGQVALADIMTAKAADSLGSSIQALKQASARFREADAVLANSRALALGVASVMPTRYRSARALLEVGDKASEAGRLLALGFDKVFSGDPGRGLDERLNVLAAYARGVMPMVKDARQASAAIDESVLPPEQRAKLAELQTSLDQADGAIQQWADLADALALLVGQDRQRIYLLVFQNDTELRPSGGFMGSVAEIVMDRGELKKIRVPPGGTYDLKGQLTARVMAPEPLRLINSLWQFQDSNWSPDFPTTAAKIRWFWSRSGQPTLDGVIAVNASFIQQILAVTGPIDMPAYGKKISSDNFFLETQKAVELEYDKQANTPKKFIGDLMRALLERSRTFKKNDWLAVAALASESLDNKQIQVAFKNEDEEALAERFGWSGMIKPTNGDSLALIEANIAGQKTDGVISEAVEHVATVGTDGGIIDKVKLTRHHGGVKGELFRGVRNVAYLRFYVPEGSELLSASGFAAPSSTLFKIPDEDAAPDTDIGPVEQGERKYDNGLVETHELGRVVYGGWVQLDPGTTQTISISYRPPFTIADIRAHLDPQAQGAGTSRGAYSLLLTSQSGKTSRTVRTRLELPTGTSVLWSRSPKKPADGQADLYFGPWASDIAVAALLDTAASVAASP